MEEVKFVTLENNKECIVLDEFNVEEEKYILLANSLNGNDLSIRKVKEDKLIGLDDEFEFNKVIAHYLIKEWRKNNAV